MKEKDSHFNVYQILKAKCMHSYIVYLSTKKKCKDCTGTQMITRTQNRDSGKPLVVIGKAFQICKC